MRSPHRSFLLCCALLGRAVHHRGGGQSDVSSLFERTVMLITAFAATVLVASLALESLSREYVRSHALVLLAKRGVQAFERSCTPGEKKGPRNTQFSRILFISCRLFAWEHSCHLGLRRALRGFLGSFSGRVKAVITVRYLTQRRDNLE